MKIAILISLSLLTINHIVVAEIPTGDVDKEKPTQAKPNLPNGVPPRKPSVDVTSVLDESSLVDFPAKIKQLETSIADLTTSNTTKQNKITSLTSKLSELEASIVLLKSSNKSITDERNRYFSELQSKSNQISNLTTQNQTLTFALNDANSQADTPVGNIFNGWVYTEDFGWSFISPDTMPYMYLQKGGWVYYEKGSNPRRVYYFDTEEWVEYE